MISEGPVYLRVVAAPEVFHGPAANLNKVTPVLPAMGKPSAGLLECDWMLAHRSVSKSALLYEAFSLRFVSPCPPNTQAASIVRLVGTRSWSAFPLPPSSEAVVIDKGNELVFSMP